MLDYLKNLWSKNNNGGLRDSLFDLPLMPGNGSSDIGPAVRNLTNQTNQAIAAFNPHKARQRLTNEPEHLWMERGQKRALALFHQAAKHVPAYKDFLQKHSIKPSQIRTIDDYKKVPPVDKANYLRHYPLDQLTWYGHLPSAQMISVSSGSSGQPFFWPRTQILDAETALEHELFLATHFEMDKYSTLFLVCFAMGMYVAGPITLNSLLRMGEKGYPVTTVTPGYSPEDVLRIIPELAPHYDQIVLAGYPPYVKEIIDKGAARGINWKDIRTRFLLAGEGFNETWRTYVAGLAGNKSPVNDFINLYGTADAAVVGHETQASIIVRRRIAEDIEARRRLFQQERMPSFLQFHPEHKYFEEVNDELVFTAPGGIPLVRYNVHDSGGVLTRADITTAIPAMKEYFDQLESEHKLWNLPFVYVYGKSDHTVILYGANVYPENIKRGLESEDIVENFSGKIIMSIDLDEKKDQRLMIEVECAPNRKPTKSLEEKTKERVYEVLLRENSEYKVVNTAIGKRTIPYIKLFEWENKKFKGKNVKHMWTAKRE